MKSKQQGPRNFLSILSTEIAKVSEYKTIQGSKAFVLLQIYFLSMIAYSVRIISNRQPYSYFQSFISITTVFPLDLEVPICIIITFVYAILLGSLLSLAYESYKTQNRVIISDLSKKKLRNNISLLTESLLWISNPIISVNIELIADYQSAWRILPICNILFQLCLILTYIYFYRSYRFNQKGLYRIFNPIEYLKFLLSFVIIVLDKFSERNISPFLSLLQSMILIQDMIWAMPFGFGFENKVFAVGNSILFSYSVLGVLAVATDSINDKNIVETGLLMIPIVLTLLKQVQWLYWQSLLQYTRVSGVRHLQIKRLCQALEALIWYIEDGRDDQLKCMLSIQMLKWHEVNCVDLNCDCREVKESQNRDQRDSMTHRSSFHSKTAIMSDGGKNSQPGQTINDLSGTKTLKDGSVLQEKVQQTKRETEAMDIDKFMIYLAKRVNQISQPMHFINKQQIDEDLISKFIKRQFTQTIQQLSFTSELDQVEFLSLKYISFMYTFKQNSPQSLAKLRQIQSRNVNFSFFFSHICKVTESFLIDSILLSHDKNDLEDVSMDVAEVWRLELIKDTIVNSIVAVLKKKIDLWDRLQSGEISSMDRMLLSVISISKQVEESIKLVDSVLDDFTITVQKTYSYYLKYQCFKALFFLSDYRQAVKYQRLMEDSWALSKQSGKAGVIGNYEWLTGDMVTVEVSVGVQTGQIVKGVNQRLVDFLNFPTLDEMEAVLRIRGIPAQQSSHTQNLYVASLMPPFLTASHNYFIQKFIQRGHTDYSGTPILSFLSDSAGFIFPVNVYLSFNFTNLHDFTLLGSIVKNKDENDYLIFDEWGRILGVGQKTFDKLIMKGALDEFGLIQFQYINHVKKNRNNKANLINKIAHDDNAKLFKKTITMHQTLKSGKSGTKRESRRTYQRPSEILLQFGSIQHFLPQIGKSLTDLISKEIFKKLQKESQQQFNKLIDQDERQQLEKQASNIFQKQVSMMVDRQQSMAGTAALQSNLLDKQQYRNFIMSNYLQSNGLMKKDVQLLQDEKLVLYVPKNYNELIEYFNDAGDRFMDNRGDFDNKSIRRQQMLSRKGDTLKQQQNCYHLFDADFQDFIDNKVRKYYSKSLLKEAISAKESKYLDMVRYKSVVNIEVGLGGVNDQDQFLYFVCKLSNLNLMTAKRKDVIKMHLKKDQRQQFEGGDDLRRSILQIQSNDSIIDRAQSSRENTLELKDSGKAKFPFYQAPEKRTEFQQNAVVSLQIPNSRTYINHEREEGPNMKVDMVPTSQKLNESSFDMDISMESQLINKKDPMISSDSIKFAEKQRSLDMKQSFGKSLGVPKFQKQHSIEVKEQKQQSDPNSEPRIDDEPQIGDDPPKPKKRFKFLEKMEKAFLENKRKNSLVNQGEKPDITQILADPKERKSSLSLLSPGNSGANIFGIMFSRLNLRRVSNVDINKNDQFEINDQGGFKEESEGTEKAISASASNSMSSNNISRDDAVNDDEDLVNKNDELVNIFEVMSQASNHQSIKSISAIAMATNISQRCFTYQPKQAQSLQIFKLLLIALNIAAIISLIITTQTYFNSIKTDTISLQVANQYKASSQVLLLSNQIFQPNIMSFPYNLNQTLFLTLINTSYQLSANISREYYQYVPNLQSAMNKGLTTPSLLTIPSKYTMSQLSDFLTQSRIELDYINSINVYINNITLQSIKAQQITFNQSLDYLTNRLIFNQIYSMAIINNLQSQSSQSMTNNSLVIVILMSSFAGLHLVVILFIVPYIKQINDLYFRVLQIVSRVTQEEAIDEIKKLTLCQHLLQTKDDQWVTQNQVKLVFYNRSKDLELTQKLRRRQEKGKDSSYFQFKLSDTNLSIWRDMVLYLMISSISIGYLIFAIVLIQTQVNSFTSYLNQYNGAVLQSISLSALMSKLSISPERYIPINNQSIPTQYTLYSYQQSNQLSYILSSIASDTQSLQSFQTILSTFVEQLNLDYSFTVDPNKITFNTQNWTSQPIISSQLAQINHLLKDNLCYYSQTAICSFISQIPYFNTGFLGAMQLINQFVINYNSLLTGFNTITFGTTTTPNNIINYIANQDYQMLVAYGNSVLNPVFDQLLALLSSQLDDKRQSKFLLVLSLFIGIGIPIMILTLILALIEMQILTRKVKRIMMSITYIPTYKFQEKIMLSLVKAFLRI